MADKYDEILQKNAFKDISPEVLSSVKDLIIKLDGKSMAESMSAIVKFAQSMPKGKPLSKQEQEAMKMAMIESLEGEEKVKFQKLMSMIEMMPK